MKNSNKFRRLISALLVAIMLVASSATAFAAMKKGEVLSVKEDYARMRKSPQQGSDVLTKIRKGTKVSYLGEKNGWIKIGLANGKSGYMYKTMLQRYSNAKVGKVYVSKLKNGKRLTVRTKASTKSKAKVAVKNTTRMVLLEKKGTWGKVRVVKTGKVGYVNLKYLKAAK